MRMISELTRRDYTTKARCTVVEVFSPFVAIGAGRCGPGAHNCYLVFAHELQVSVRRAKLSHLGSLRRRASGRGPLEWDGIAIRRLPWGLCRHYSETRPHRQTPRPRSMHVSTRRLLMKRRSYNPSNFVPVSTVAAMVSRCCGSIKKRSGDERVCYLWTIR